MQQTLNIMQGPFFFFFHTVTNFTNLKALQLCRGVQAERERKGSGGGGGGGEGSGPFKAAGIGRIPGLQQMPLPLVKRFLIVNNRVSQYTQNLPHVSVPTLYQTSVSGSIVSPSVGFQTCVCE